MKIGYACITLGVYGIKQHSCRIKNATPERLKALIESNITTLDQTLDYNLDNDIKLFRISSGIIPFASHPMNTLRWWEIFSNSLKTLGQKAHDNGIRLSMHPGQYTVLNAIDEGVVSRAVADLRYHARLMDAMGLGPENKIILHIGGVYGDKGAATQRFIKQYRALDETIRKRLVIENDDHQYTIAEVLSIGEREGIPVVFDHLNHQVNLDNTRSEKAWIAACAKTWKAIDGPQKIHYSQQDVSKRPGAHSATIDLPQFLDFYRQLENHEVDIMLEVKDQNLSAIKCINALAWPKIKRLEKEWARYKYLVLEHSAKEYKAIRELLKDKQAYPVVVFYSLIEEAMEKPVATGSAVNTAQHIWGYFKASADLKTKQDFEKKRPKISSGGSSKEMKRFLLKLSLGQYPYLVASLYFMEVFS